MERHPDDIDTTSLAMILLPNNVEKANSILDEVLMYRTEDGIIMVKSLPSSQRLWDLIILSGGPDFRTDILR